MSLPYVECPWPPNTSRPQMVITGKVDLSTGKVIAFAAEDSVGRPVRFPELQIDLAHAELVSSARELSR